MPQIELRGLSIRYSLRTSKRAKRVSLRCSSENGLEIVYPNGQCEPSAEALLRQNCDWVRASIEKLRQADDKRPRRDYSPREVFMYRGEPLSLKLTSSAQCKRAFAKMEGNTLWLTIPAAPQELDKMVKREAVIAFYRRQARHFLPKRASQLATRTGFKLTSVRIKNQKTRWGSCSVKGNINLNLRLMMAPDAAIDYVIIHELCHLRELNHSPAFWRLVESHCADYAHWRAWFKEHGSRLIL